MGQELIARARAWCASMPAAVLEFPFGDDAAVYKVGGKVFALATMAEDPGFVTVKIDPEAGEALRNRYTYIREGYYMNKRHWVSIDLGSDADPQLVEELVEDSYDLVVAGLTVKARAALGLDSR